VNDIHKAFLADAQSGSFHRLDITPDIHCNAERLLLSMDSPPLRTLDALQITLALSAQAQTVVTFDTRTADAAVLHGLEIVQLMQGR
jgi:predicted nucleic acid-binding protein